MNNEQIEQIINEMLSGSENHMEAEMIYTKMIEQSPFEITNYHIQYIIDNLMNNNAVRRGLTLLHQILNKSTVYAKYSPEQNSFIQTKLLEMLLEPNLDENNREYLVDIIEIAQKNYNNDKLISNAEYGWPSVFEFCINISLSDDKIISSLGIELISRFVKFGTFNVTTNIQLIKDIIQKVFMTEEKFLPQIISTIDLVSECFVEEDTIKKYAPNIIQFIQVIQPEVSKKLIQSVYRIPIEFFLEILPFFISTISSLFADYRFPIDTKYCVIDIFYIYISSSQVKLFESPELYIPIIQSISIVFTFVNSEDDLSLTEHTKSLLENMSERVQSEQFDHACLSIASEFIQNEDWKFRFSGLSILRSILVPIEDEDLIKMIPFVLKSIQDPSTLCRKASYKILKNISSNRQKLFASELQSILFPTLLQSFAIEPSPDIVIYAFKVLARFCENSGSEILKQYYQSIIQLCSIYSNENNIPLQVLIIDCLRCLCNSMRENLSDSYPLIKQYIMNMSTIDIPIIRYSAIRAIPYLCKIIPSSNPEKIKMAEFGLNLFIGAFSLQQQQQIYDEHQQLVLFSSFRKFIKIVGVQNNVEIFQIVVMSLLGIASQQIELQILSDDDDELMLPKNIIIIKSQQFNHQALFYSNEKCREVNGAFYDLTKLIESFPEQFIPIINQIMTIIVQAYNQVPLNLYIVSNKITAFQFSCLNTLIQKADLLCIPFQSFIEIIREIFSFIGIKQIIILLKNLILKFNDPILVQPSIDIVNQSYEEIKIKLKECNEEFAKIKDNPNLKEDQESILTHYKNERKNEYLIAKFFAFLIEKFPMILDQNFVQNLRSSFQREDNQNNTLSFLIIETEIQSLTTKQFAFILSHLSSYIDFYGKECLYSLEIIDKIVNSTDDPQILEQSYQLVLSILKFDDEVFENYPYLSTKAIDSIVILYQKFPPSINNESLNLFIEFIPVYGDNCKAVHHIFASILQQNPDFFSSEDNLILTLEIIAKTCKGHFIDDETRAIFRQFMQTIFAQESSSPLISQNLNELDEIYSDRLRSFANDVLAL